LVITQLDTNLVSAIIGMYFGGSLAKGRWWTLETLWTY
jgi:hypothetical protein